jgi:hypothetical protein
MPQNIAPWAVEDITSSSTVTADPRVLFIGGLGRSGTTLLERLLGQVDGVQTLGETVHLWLRGIRRGETCGCGKPFHECPFWTSVGEVAFGGWDKVDVAELVSLHDQVDRLRKVPSVVARPSDDVRRYANAYQSIYQAAQEVSGASLIVDSSKHPSMAYCLRVCEDINLRVLHVVRDPRAVAYSWSKTVERPEDTGGDPWMHRFTPSRSATLWTVENAAMSGLARLGVPVLRVQYEDFVAEPATAIREVLAFAGMPADAAVPIEGHRAVLSPTHTVSGNPMRLLNGPLDIQRDDDWLTRFGSRDRSVVSAITAPLRLAYRFGDRSR